jgi:hypothetical protein
MCDASLDLNDGRISAYLNGTLISQSSAEESPSSAQVFRFFAELYGAQMARWISAEAEYWAAFDQLMDEVERLDLYPSRSLSNSLLSPAAHFTLTR